MERENFLVHIVDSDPAIADGLATLLRTYGIETLTYPDAQAFLRFWLPRRSCNCCLIAEADSPGLSGPALLQELRELHMEMPVLLLAGKTSPELAEVARGSNQVGVIEKPCVDRTLIERVLRLRGAA